VASAPVVPDAGTATRDIRPASAAARTAAGGGNGAAAAVSAVPEVAVEVWWADVTRVEGDVHAVGHYENVLPQFAELALDRVVSGRTAPDTELVLTNLTRRGLLRGALGSVAFFPWASGQGPGRLVAVAGMGHPGSLGQPELRRLARNLTWAVTALPDVQTVCTVLIGAGSGNLDVPLAVGALVSGLVDGLGGVTRRTMQRVRIVERELGKAREIHRCLLVQRDAPAMRGRIALTLDADVQTGEGGDLGDDYCLGLMIAAAAAAAGASATPDQRGALDAMLAHVTDPEAFGAKAVAALGRLSGGGTLRAADIAAAVRVHLGDDAPQTSSVSSRLSFVRGTDGISVAALTDTAVIPERTNHIDFALLEEAVADMINPAADRVPQLAASLHRLVLPQEFRPILTADRPVVFETDRAMAKIHWEMMARSVDDPDGQPLALQVPVSRQLRTSYSPPPGVERVARWPLRALVIGDPGDPAAGHALPGAREEAEQVAAMLREKGLDVELMIGAEVGPPDGQRRPVRAARRLDVLNRLMEGGFDLLHFAGHGDFDPLNPARTGWVFKGGLLTARELERIDLAPGLVVANACLSARTSETLAGGATVGVSRSEAELLPGLADEFFRRGVRNYVGTAWEVNDLGAVLFAQKFYDALIPSADDDGNEPATVGGALLAARTALRAEESRFGALWAAYQHYGDPGHVLVAPRPSPAAEREQEPPR